MAETGNQEGERKPGLYRKVEAPIDISNAKVEDVINLGKVSRRTGIEFAFDGDKNTVTPERLVVIPEEKKP